MTHLEALARDYANKLYPVGNDEHEGTFVTDEAYPEDYRLDVCGAFLAGALARQPEIDELVAALEDIVAAYKRGCVDYKGCECWWQIALNALKKHGSAKDV